ncbi:MAG: Trm112 family protein [Proteobacteria bacterium]|nr:Trm112 family protein [Pseudomonadota bacterium]MBS0461027.1 Trm112 family protein [Pseudomonadota bacterium]MBS0465397.1 Trm112 family protein [Pseudomonadota bacterium]
MDRRLLDILCCPSTRQPLAMLQAHELEAINRAVAVGSLRCADGSAQAEPLREGLITRDRKLVYRIADGIPVLLADEAISCAQITDFPT